MADTEMLTEKDDEIDEGKEPAGELVTITEDDDEQKAGQTARAKADNTAAAATRGEGDDEDEDVEAVVAQGKKPGRMSQKERRALQRQARDRQEREMALLRQQNTRFAQELEELKRTGSKRDAASITERMADAKRRMQESEELMATAIAKGEGEAHVRLLRIRDAAANEFNELAAEREQIVRAEERPDTRRDPQAAARDEKARVVSENKARFHSRNPWFGTDAEATAVATDIDKAVYAAGFDPSTAAYWVELENRLREAQDDGDLVVGRRPRAAGQRRTPPSGVGRSERAPSGKRSTQIFVSQARIDAMKEAGQWDDPKTRNRVLRRFQEYDKSNAAS